MLTGRELASRRGAEPAELLAAGPRPAALERPRPAPLPPQGGESALFNIWGPFVKYGQRQRHTGWLADGRGEHAGALIARVEEHFRQRQIPQTRIAKSYLTARGLIVDRRAYFILSRNLATVALYITAFGRDLFVSLVSYLKPPVSAFRVALVMTMLAFQAFMSLFYPAMLSEAFQQFAGGLSLLSGAPDASGLLALLCIVWPVGLLNTLALVLFCLYSTYKWVSSRDFLAALRVPPNEFNQDDLMAMEKAVEQTVRKSLDEIGLQPDDLQLARPWELQQRLF
jgi:hypothetical protein